MKRVVQLREKSIVVAVPLMLSFWACTNPTVDPGSTFTISGSALDVDGVALKNAEVHLVRFFDPLKLTQPVVDTYFECAKSDAAGGCGHTELGLEVALVKTAQTDTQGLFVMSVKGEEIVAKEGLTDAQGRKEVSNLVLVVYDPKDATKRSGVVSLDHLFQQTDKDWSAGAFRMWKSGATVDMDRTATTGMVKFVWNKLDQDVSATLSNIYRVDVPGPNNRRMVIWCRVGQGGEDGGCAIDPLDPKKLTASVSAYALFRFYSAGSKIQPFVLATGATYRYRAPFGETALADPTAGRDPVGIEGIWAVGDPPDQALKGSKADDGDVESQADITNRAHSIYVKLSGGGVPVTDAGLLNTKAKDAAFSCVTAEFSTTLHTGIVQAKASGTSDWVKKGRFCGATGAPDEIAALLSFDTTSSDGQVAAWMRFVIAKDPNASTAASPVFQKVGEVAVYRKK